MACHKMTNQTQKLYSSLKSILLHIDHQEKELLSKFDLSLVRFFILKHVFNHPGINYKDLSDKLLCSKGNTTRIVTAMQHEGLVTRDEDLSDRRSFNLSLTERGEDLYKEVNLAYKNYINWLLSGFDEKKLSSCIEATQTIENVIKSESD
jgi:DNA-binding MarR family transcriptional regulator